MHFLKSSLFVFIFLNLTAFCQNFAEDAKIYFSDFRSKNLMDELIIKSLPTINVAKKIFFKEEDAKQFIVYMEALEKALKEKEKIQDESFDNVEINTFTKKEIEENKTNYNLGLLKVIDKIKPSVRFYTIKLMNDGIFATGFSYIYWVFIDKKWYFISLPQNAFKK